MIIVCNGFKGIPTLHQDPSVTTGSYLTKLPNSHSFSIYVRMNSFFLLLISHLQNSFIPSSFISNPRKSFLSVLSQT